MYNITSGSLRTWTDIDIRYHAGVSNEMLVFLGDFFLHYEAWIGPGTPWGLWCEIFKETFPEQYRSIDPWLWLQRAKVISVNSVCTGNLDTLPSTCTLTIYKKSEKFAVRETSERERKRERKREREIIPGGRLSMLPLMRTQKIYVCRHDFMLLRRSEILTTRFFVDTLKRSFVDSMGILRNLMVI